jgi:hypothetical protein
LRLSGYRPQPGLDGVLAKGILEVAAHLSQRSPRLARRRDELTGVLRQISTEANWYFVVSGDDTSHIRQLVRGLSIVVSNCVPQALQMRRSSLPTMAALMAVKG